MVVPGPDGDKNLAITHLDTPCPQLCLRVHSGILLWGGLWKDNFSYCKGHLFAVYIAFAVVSKTIMPHSLSS